MLTPNRYVQQSNPNTPLVTFDAAGRFRTGFLSTTGDYKQVGYDHTMLFDNAGTGTGGWANNKYTMSVAGSQYLVKQSKRVHPYFSGKSQLVEVTFDGFQHEENITKRVGYFSSSVVAPYTASLDGFWLESDGDDYYLVASRAGTETVRVATQGWDNWTDANHYDWSMFTVIMFDFLWLGGAVLRLWLKLDSGFVLLHTVRYAGSSKDVFILNPSQPLRCEIRANNGGGQMRYICAQVATEGDIGLSGIVSSVNTGTPEITLAAVDTTYPVIAVRKQAARLEAAIELIGVDIGVGSANDRGVWSIQINPTLSAGLTYADVANTGIQKANGDGVVTVTAAGFVIASGPVSTNVPIPRTEFIQNFLTRLSQTIAGSMDEYVLCLGCQTAGILISGYMDLKEY